MLKVKRIVATAPEKVELESYDLDETQLAPDRLLVKTAYSAVSAGTECAWISGNSNNTSQSFPWYPGYSAVGHVVAVGRDVKGFEVGDAVVVPWNGHRSYMTPLAGRVAGGAHKISVELPSLKEAAFTHIASFPMLGVRRLGLQMGESVMIAGLGILGQIALQAARYSGAAPLMACDFSPERRELALKLGADAVFDPQEPDFIEKVRAYGAQGNYNPAASRLSGGPGVNAVVEVTGKAAALKQALAYTAKMGRISLLGCTRVADCPIDFYREVHLPGITLIGAHTSNRPTAESRPGQWTEHDDYDVILRMLASRRFNFAPLIHWTVNPAECAHVYDTLLHGTNPPMGIVYDWSLLEE